MKNWPKLRSIRSRILTLLVGIALLFVAGLWVMNWSNRVFVSAIFEGARAEKLSLSQEIVTLKGNSLQAVIFDYTYSDEFVRAIESREKARITSEIAPSFEASNVDAAMIVSPDGKPFFHWQPTGTDPITFPIAKASLTESADQPFSHYFTQVGHQVMEIYTGSIHLTKDAERQGKAYGRLYIGRLWSKPYLDSLAKLTGTTISIRFSESSPKVETNERSGEYNIEMPLKGPTSEPVATAEFNCIDPVVASLHSQSAYAIVSVVGFAVLTIALIMFFLMRWVSRPLEAVSRSLRYSDRNSLGRVLRDETEIGEVANLVMMNLDAQDNYKFQGEVLEYRVQQRTSQLESTNRAMIEGWSRALDIRDHETEGHTRRVAEMAVRLGTQLGLEGHDLDCLYRGAMLHDIGKLGIPDSILQKPGFFTEEEQAVMRTHPALAAEMLSPIESVQDCIDIPVCHHEKWDGTGYPRGLCGHEIPWLARIFAVADVWDAMRSDRPYREGLSESEVREFIESQAGTHFDPKVVKAYLEMEQMEHPKDSAEYIAPRFRAA